MDDDPLVVDEVTSRKCQRGDHHLASCGICKSDAVDADVTFKGFCNKGSMQLVMLFPGVQSHMKLGQLFNLALDDILLTDVFDTLDETFIA